MVERRELKNDNETGELFKRPKVFHNTITNVVIILFGVCANGNFFGARANFADSAIRSDQVAEYEPDTFWRLVGRKEVIEIDVLELPYFKAENAKNH